MDCVIFPPSPFFLEDDVITVKTPAFAESVTEGDVRCVLSISGVGIKPTTPRLSEESGCRKGD